MTPASIEYTGQALELTASVMGMLQRSIDLLSIYGIPAPFQIPAIAGASAGPSVPPKAAGGPDEGCQCTAKANIGLLVPRVVHRRLPQMTKSLMRRQSHLRMRLEMAQVQTQAVELTVVILDLCPGRKRGGIPALEATDADFRCSLFFLLYFPFC